MKHYEVLKYLKKGVERELIEQVDENHFKTKDEIAIA